MKTTKALNGLLGVTLALTLLLTGCSRGSESGTSDSTRSGQTAPVSTPSTQTTSGSAMQRYEKVVSVADIKNAYGSMENDDVMPLYNVEPDETFEFKFKSNWFDSDTDAYPVDMVTVHTDPACTEQSRLYTGNLFDEDGTTLRVSPIGGVLTTDSEEDNYIENKVEVWGNASMYYIALWYDTEAEGFIKLDKPVVIPFTVKHELGIPTVKGVVDATGRFKLVWDAVEGATSYNIYWFGNTDINWTGDRNEPVAGADSAYDVHGECHLLKDSSTTETEFDNFAGKDHGLAIHYHDELDEDDTDYILGQNYSVNGSYFVTAVFGDKESGLSNIVNTSDLILPHKIVEEQDPMFQRYESDDDLPRTVSVLNIDGSVTERNVIYKFHWSKTLLGTDYPTYRYRVEGTAITGECSMEIENGGMERYKDKQEGDAPSGAVNNYFDNSTKAEPENNTPFNPDSSVPTIIEPDHETGANTPNPEDDPNVQVPETLPDSSEPISTLEPDDSYEKTLVERQTENTKKHVENGNRAIIQQTEYAIFAESAEEEWLARNLIEGGRRISLEAFPSLQQYETLMDVFQKVYYQNPYVLGVTSYRYDYATLTLEVNYCYSMDEIAQKQSELRAASEKIIGDVITNSMSEEEKCRAIYDYFNDNTSYDDDAVEAAEENNFTKGGDWKEHEDAFNAYGIIVKKRGVCQSYALSYKLLCSLCGVESKVITGYLDGSLPHAWSAVKLDGEWYQTDCTNNASNCGIPFFLYEAGKDDLAMMGYSEDKLYDLDTAVGRFAVDDSQREYYEANGLCADSAEQFKDILGECLENAGEVIAIRFIGDSISQEEIIRAVKEVYNMKGMEDKLPTLGLGFVNGYILLISK